MAAAAAAAARAAAEALRIRKVCSTLTMSKLGIPKDFDWDRNKFLEQKAMILTKLNNVTGYRLTPMLIGTAVFNEHLALGFGAEIHTMENALAINMALVGLFIEWAGKKMQDIITCTPHWTNAVATFNIDGTAFNPAADRVADLTDVPHISVIWHKLEDQQFPNLASHRTNIEDQLRDTKMIKNFIAYRNEIENHFATLASMGTPLSEEKKLEALFRGISDPDAYKLGLFYKNPGLLAPGVRPAPLPSYPDASKAMEAYFNDKIYNKSSEPRAAAAAVASVNVAQSKPSERITLICTHCKSIGKPGEGHNAEHCFFLHPELRPERAYGRGRGRGGFFRGRGRGRGGFGRGRGASTGNRACYACHSTEHTIHDCPQFKSFTEANAHPRASNAQAVAQPNQAPVRVNNGDNQPNRARAEQKENRPLAFPAFVVAHLSESETDAAQGSLSMADSGANRHMVAKREYFINLYKLDEPVTIHGFIGSAATATHHGECKVPILLNGRRTYIRLHDAYFVPDSNFTLISETMLQSKGCRSISEASTDGQTGSWRAYYGDELVLTCKTANE